MKADKHFPICVSGCGRRGDKVVWYQVTDSMRFGECLRCYGDRLDREDKLGPGMSGPGWDPPEEPTGPGDHPLPWTLG